MCIQNKIRLSWVHAILIAHLETLEYRRKYLLHKVCHPRDRPSNNVPQINVAISSPRQSSSVLIISSCITTYLQDMDTLAHGVASKVALKLWSLQSLWEGACALLSTGDYDRPFIKVHLHWKLGTLLLCLYSAVYVALYHSATMS